MTRMTRTGFTGRRAMKSPYVLLHVGRSGAQTSSRLRENTRRVLLVTAWAISLACSSAKADPLFKLDWKLGSSNGSSSAPRTATHPTEASAPLHAAEAAKTPASGTPGGITTSTRRGSAASQTPLPVTLEETMKELSSRPVATRGFEVAGVRLGMTEEEVVRKLSAFKPKLTTTTDRANAMIRATSGAGYPAYNIWASFGAAPWARLVELRLSISYDAKTAPTLAGAKAVAKEKFAACATPSVVSRPEEFALHCAWSRDGSAMTADEVQNNACKFGQVPGEQSFAPACGETFLYRYSLNQSGQGTLNTWLRDGRASDLARHANILESNRINEQSIRDARKQAPDKPQL